jgi:hypothetical protein
MKVQRLYTKLHCGGIGDAPILFKVGKEYYIVRGDVDGKGYEKVIELFPRNIKKERYVFWVRYVRTAKWVSPSEFLKIIQEKEEDRSERGLLVEKSRR